MIQQFHSGVYIWRKPLFKKIHAYQCSQQHYLQQPRYANNLSVQQMDKEDVVYTQWYTAVAAAAKSHQSCPTLCDPTTQS